MSKKIAKKDLQDIERNLTTISDDDVLPPEIVKLLEDRMPEWLKEYEADGSAVQRWMHEYLILMLEILRLDYGFVENDLEKIEKRIKEMLPVLYKMKMEDTKLMRKADMAVGLAMVERNKVLFKAEKAGIALPNGEVKKIK